MKDSGALQSGPLRWIIFNATLFQVHELRGVQAQVQCQRLRREVRRQEPPLQEEELTLSQGDPFRHLCRCRHHLCYFKKTECISFSFGKLASENDSVSQTI